MKDAKSREWIVPTHKVVENVLNAKTKSGIKSHKQANSAPNDLSYNLVVRVDDINFCGL